MFFAVKRFGQKVARFWSKSGKVFKIMKIKTTTLQEKRRSVLPGILRMFLRYIKVPLDPLKCQVAHPSFFPAKLLF